MSADESLIAFVRARLAERQQHLEEVRADDEEEHSRVLESPDLNEGYIEVEALHGLREIEAMREMLVLAENAAAWAEEQPMPHRAAQMFGHNVLALLAHIWRDHADYRPEWEDPVGSPQ